MRPFWPTLALLLQLPFGAALAQSGVYVDIRASDAPGAPVVERWKLYGASYALVIGIDSYSRGWPRLSNAVKDARLVGAALEQRGFEVEYLFNASSAELRGRLRRFFAIKGADPEARLFVWFAGHGHTENGEGYLVPSDSPPAGQPEFRLTALHMGDVGSMVRIAQSKHVLAVFDSCFAGTIFSSQRARPPAAITRAAVQPVRQFLTSGDADQQVSDDGTFRTLFLRAISGEESADANGDGYLTGSELSLHLEDRMINLTQALQTPRGGKLRDPKFDRGDFLFVLPRTMGVAPSSHAVGGPDSAAFDLEFWNAIKDSDNPADYQAYLQSFPNGRFAPLARRRAQTSPPLAPVPQSAAPDQPVTPPAPSVAALPPASGEEIKRYVQAHKWDLARPLTRVLKRDNLGFGTRAKVTSVDGVEILGVTGGDHILVLSFTVTELNTLRLGKGEFLVRYANGELEILKLLREIH